MNTKNKAGYKNGPREMAIVELIVTKGAVTAKELEEHYIQTSKKPGIKSGNNVHRYLRNLMNTNPPTIKKDSEERYVMADRTEFIEPPSEVDRFILEECKKLVADIMSSGLLKTFSSIIDESAKKRLLQRCWYLNGALNELMIRRQKDLKILSWSSPWSILGKPVTYKREPVEGSYSMEDVEPSLEEELFYFLGVIDSLSRFIEAYDKGIKRPGSKAKAISALVPSSK